MMLIIRGSSGPMIVIGDTLRARRLDRFNGVRGDQLPAARLTHRGGEDAIALDDGARSGTPGAHLVEHSLKRGRDAASRGAACRSAGGRGGEPSPRSGSTSSDGYECGCESASGRSIRQP